ncbi:hypothetical protein KGM_208063 [Danaus plexippus plexippus]|uniref:Uncharacterized protein n=1 Tax=Danaus plexippus plexippus TaxID=278856 RepID=A0A212FPM0_DANPL|nr:hypothetical protein KGM_208063 [Danaus plexippus plexippus]
MRRSCGAGSKCPSASCSASACDDTRRATDSAALAPSVLMQDSFTWTRRHINDSYWRSN